VSEKIIKFHIGKETYHKNGWLIYNIIASKLNLCLSLVVRGFHYQEVYSRLFVPISCDALITNFFGIDLLVVNRSIRVLFR
jgi:hypothetical protein